MTVKEIMKEIIENQPEDASFEEILRELVFHNRIERGLADARDGRVISNEEMGSQIKRFKFEYPNLYKFKNSVKL